ncbi:PaaI family thioesterase [Halomarina litorea]|uniref:PaaI family thioesterase n=1 Tax=Halomarina litorea TaxID=2961595 RepID=UPI0020C32B93|nr:PaaI family thioesterase [Halomarina sp. BCD28]
MGESDASSRREDDAEETVEARERRLREEAAQHGLFGLLGLDVESAREGRAVLTVPFDETFTNLPNDSMHGGVTAALIDTASGFALRSTFGSGVGLTTTDMNVRYVRPATADLRAEAHVVRAGTSVGVTECEVTSVAPDGDRKVVATGGTTYRLFRGDSA